MAANATIQGECDQRFERVKRVFAENFERRDELGATVAVTLDGRPVVDLWGGHLDHAKTKPWQRDNIVNVWSTTKGLTAICAHKLAGEGKLDLDAPVTKYWPEFAQGGKAKVPVSYLLNHKAGLAAIRAPLRNRRPLQLGSGNARIGPSGTVVDPGYQTWLPRHHLRMARRRSRAPGQRQEPRHLFS